MYDALCNYAIRTMMNLLLFGHSYRLIQLFGHPVYAKERVFYSIAFIVHPTHFVVLILMVLLMLYAQRDSKLTRMLQNSLGGNAKTTLIVTASPSAFVRQFLRILFLSKWYIYRVSFVLLMMDTE
jgi:hypothetical protein